MQVDHSAALAHYRGLAAEAAAMEDRPPRDDGREPTAQQEWEAEYERQLYALDADDVRQELHDVAPAIAGLVALGEPAAIGSLVLGVMELYVRRITDRVVYGAPQ